MPTIDDLLGALRAGRAIDLGGVSAADLARVVSVASRAALALGSAPEGMAATRALMASLHAAAERLPVGIDPPGLVIALAMQCSQVQGVRGGGMDPQAVAWARDRAGREAAGMATI